MELVEKEEKVRCYQKKMDPETFCTNLMVITQQNSKADTHKKRK